MTVPLQRIRYEDLNAVAVRDFKRKFEYYIQANKLSAEEQSIKLAHLKSAMDLETDELVQSFKIPEETCEKVLKALIEHYEPKKNATMNQYNFFTCHQESGEPFQSFYARLKKLSVLCEFGELEDSILKTRIILGITDKELQQRLLRNEHSLSDIISYCKNTEEALNNQRVINKDEVSVSKVSTFRRRRPQSALSNKTNYSKSHKFGKKAPSSQEEYDCRRCGRRHIPRNCPAYGKTCSCCRKKGHFTTQCNKKTRKVHLMHDSLDSHNDEYSSDEDYSLGKNCKLATLICSLSSNNGWVQDCKINNHNIRFKIDTGADISILPFSVLKQIGIGTDKLKPCRLNISAYGGFRIKPEGTIKLTLTTGELSHVLTFVVVRETRVMKKVTPILGVGACEQLNLVQRIHKITQCNSDRAAECGRDELVHKYNSVFKGLGKFPNQTKISLKPDCENPTVQPPRRVAHSLLPKLEKTLHNLESKGIIEAVSKPESWVSNLVVVEKPSGDLRLCLDPVDLNRNIQVDKFLVPTLDDIKASLAGKSIFSVLDLKDGFYQIELDPESRHLCTFNSPFGYWKFCRLPFGISIAPEVFSRYNQQCFGNIENVIIYCDDILIASSTVEEHLNTLNKVFQRALDLNIKFNLSKFQFMMPEIKYLGLLFSKEGTKPDKERIQALQHIKVPSNRKQLQSVMGMFNYLREFIPNMAEITSPLRLLLKKNIEWHWGDAQNEALHKLIEIISQTPTLANFDSKLPIAIECDSSQSGIGTYLSQKGRPIAFASRSLNSAEQNYPQIEKEMLAILFSCSKFHNYIYGHQVQVFTDHKPLVSIFKKKLVQSSF